MLRLARQAIRFTDALRLTLIGHLFYYLLFGAVGGDLAKSALAARWHRLPLPEGLSAARLDRLAAFGGLIILVLLATGVGALEGAFAIDAARRTALAVVGALVVLLLLLGSLASARRFEPRGPSAFARWSRTSLASFGLLFQRPKDGFAALGCGLLQQVSLSAVLAFNLAAVTDVPAAWARMAWCLPVIWLLSGLPVTVAGLGFREGAAVTLFGLYGVDPAHATAASLLVLPVSLVWAVVGAAWWVTSRSRGRQEEGS
jgi:hypothetical protein